MWAPSYSSQLSESPRPGPTQPVQIYHGIEKVGKTIEKSKKRITWRFCFGQSGDEHELVLEHSVFSGKKKLYLNGNLFYELKKVGNFEWSYSWPMGSHVCRCDILHDKYQFTIDARPFTRWFRPDSNQVREVRTAKQTRERSLQSEQKRLDIRNKDKKEHHDTFKFDRSRRHTQDAVARRANSTRNIASLPPLSHLEKQKSAPILFSKNSSSTNYSSGYDILSSDFLSNSARTPKPSPTKVQNHQITHNASDGVIRNESEMMLKLGLQLQGTAIGNSNLQNSQSHSYLQQSNTPQLNSLPSTLNSQQHPPNVQQSSWRTSPFSTQVLNPFSDATIVPPPINQWYSNINYYPPHMEMMSGHSMTSNSFAHQANEMVSYPEMLPPWCDQRVPNQVYHTQPTFSSYANSEVDAYASHTRQLEYQPYLTNPYM